MTDRVKQFYDFMIERELIRQRRLAGLPRAEWTQDLVFQTYSFTNVKRHHDRTTTLLKRIYEEHELASDYEKLLNCALYRFFGTIDSARAIGWMRDMRETRQRVLELGPTLSFTSAYIVSSAGRSEPKYNVVLDYVESISGRAEEILRWDTWERAVAELKLCFGVGSFMAKEIYLDYLLATEDTPDDWQTWTPVGPGGKRGAARVRYGINTQIPEAEALEVIREIYAQRDTHWPDRLHESGRRYDLPSLDITDIQFQLCEFDKYGRVAEGRRPKRRFRPTVDYVTCPTVSLDEGLNGL